MNSQDISVYIVSSSFTESFWVSVRFHSHVAISIALVWSVWVIVVLQFKAEVSEKKKFNFIEMKSGWKRLHPLFVFSFPWNQIFAVVSVLSSSRFVFLYFNEKKKEWYIPYFLVPTLHLISLKKKKRGFILLPLRFVISSIYFFQKYFSSQLSCSHPLSYCCSISQQKRKKKSRRFQLFTLKVLFTLVSRGCRKSENTTSKLVARRREVLCLVSLFKSFFDLGIFIFI